MHWGLRLKEIREARGYSQSALAERAGIKQQMISRLELGTADTTGDVVPLARALGVSAEWLYTGIGPVSASPTETRDDPAEYTVRPDLSPQEIALIQYFRGLTDGQKAECLRNLQGQKSLNEELLAELLKRNVA